MKKKKKILLLSNVIIYIGFISVLVVLNTNIEEFKRLGIIDYLSYSLIVLIIIKTVIEILIAKHLFSQINYPGIISKVLYLLVLIGDFFVPVLPKYQSFLLLKNTIISYLILNIFLSFLCNYLSKKSKIPNL